MKLFLVADAVHFEIPSHNGTHLCSCDCYQDNDDKHVDARAIDKESDGDVPSNTEGACKDSERATNVVKAGGEGAATATGGSNDRGREGGLSDAISTGNPHM